MDIGRAEPSLEKQMRHCQMFSVNVLMENAFEVLLLRSPTPNLV